MLDGEAQALRKSAHGALHALMEADRTKVRNRPAVFGVHVLRDVQECIITVKVSLHDLAQRVLIRDRRAADGGKEHPRDAVCELVRSQEIHQDQDGRQ